MNGYDPVIDHLQAAYDNDDGIRDVPDDGFDELAADAEREDA
jgi:hypothetical protein